MAICQRQCKQAIIIVDWLGDFVIHLLPSKSHSINICSLNTLFLVEKKQISTEYVLSYIFRVLEIVKKKLTILEFFGNVENFEMFGNCNFFSENYKLQFPKEESNYDVGRGICDQSAKRWRVLWHNVAIYLCHAEIRSNRAKEFTLKTRLFLGRSWRGRVQAEKF